MNDCTSLTRFSKFDEASHTFIPGIEIIVDIVRAFQCGCGTVNYAIHVDLDLYSVRQKQCSKFSNEESLVILTVNLYEILHASSYGI